MTAVKEKAKRVNLYLTVEDQKRVAMLKSLMPISRA